MFSLFKKKSPIEKRYEKYEALLEEAFKLSTTNRSASDQKHKEAEEILDEIKRLEALQR